MLQRRREGCPRQGRPAAGDLRQGQPVRRAAGPRPPGPARHQPEARRDRQEDRRAAARHQRLALHPPRRPREPRRAAVRADRRADLRPEAVQVRGPGALPQVGAGDALPVPRAPRGVRQHALDRRAGRVRDRVRRRPAAELPDARRASPNDSQYLDHLTWEGAKRRWGDDLPASVVERVAYELKVINDMGFASYFLIIVGPHQVRPRRGHPGRPGPRVGRRAARSRTACWITDLDPIKYDLLFERFLNPSRISMPDIDMDFDSRYRDQMIRYAADTLRPRPRRPDHHVRHDQGPQRRARRGPGARLPVRRRRQGRQGDAAARDGARHAAQVLLRAEREVRRRVQGGRRPAGACTTPTPTSRRSSTSPRASKG